MRTLSFSFSFSFSFFALFLILSFPFFAVAEETAVSEEAAVAAETVPEEQSESDEDALNPYIAPIIEEAKNISQTLGKQEIETLVHVKTNFGMLRAIRVAKADVQNATEACAKENASMADDISTRFSAWSDVLSPLIEGQEENMQKAISARFKDPESITNYLGMIDTAAAYAEKQIDKVPVTTLQACTALLNSMDTSEEGLSKALSEMTWPEEESAAETETSAVTEGE